MQVIVSELIRQAGPSGLIGDTFTEERRAKPPCQAFGGRWLSNEVPGQGLGAEPRGLAENGFLSIVVVGCSYMKFPLSDCQTRQGPRAFLDVGFGVLADAQREQFHQFAGEVFVGLALAVRWGVEPDEQGRVAEHGVQQVAEWAATELLECIVLHAHRGDIVDLELAGCEVVVPGEREAFAKRVRREKSPIEPPCFEPPRVRRAAGCIGQDGCRLVDVSGNARHAAIRPPTRGRRPARDRPPGRARAQARWRRSRPGAGASRRARGSRGRTLMGDKEPMELCSFTPISPPPRSPLSSVQI